jgi:hypothetical protein
MADDSKWNPREDEVDEEDEEEVDDSVGPSTSSRILLVNTPLTSPLP